MLGYFSLSTSIGLTHLLSPLHFVFASNPELLVLQTQPHGHRKHKWQGSLLNLWSGRFLTCFLSDAFVSFIHHPCLRYSAGHLFYRLCYCSPFFLSLSFLLYRSTRKWNKNNRQRKKQQSTPTPARRRRHRCVVRVRFSSLRHGVDDFYLMTYISFAFFFSLL